MRSIIDSLKGHFGVGRLFRVGFGLTLVAIAGLVYMPGVLNTVSSDAIINGRTVSVLSPIEGRVVIAPPREGTLVRAGQTLAEIRNPSVDQTYLLQSSNDLHALQEKSAALAQLDTELAEMEQRLVGEHKRQIAAQIARLEMLIEEERAAIAVAEATATYNRGEFERKSTLGRSGSVSIQAVDRARSDATAADAEVDRHRHILERYRRDLEAVRAGVLFADLQFETQQLQLRIDEIRLKRAEIAAQLREQRGQAAGIERNVQAEETRIHGRSVARVVAPMDALVWRSMAVAGGRIAVDAQILTLIDCTQLVVHARLPTRRFDEVRPGAEATIKLLGGSGEKQAVVRDLRAMGGSEKGDRFAAPLPAIGRDEFLATFAMRDPLNLVDAADFCNVGRSVEVTMDRGSGPADSAFRAVSRWISQQVSPIEAVAGDRGTSSSGSVQTACSSFSSDAATCSKQIGQAP